MPKFSWADDFYKINKKILKIDLCDFVHLNLNVYQWHESSREQQREREKEREREQERETEILRELP